MVSLMALARLGDGFFDDIFLGFLDGSFDGITRLDSILLGFSDGFFDCARLTRWLLARLSRRFFNGI